jgi:DNA topoisomerase-1
MGEISTPIKLSAKKLKAVLGDPKKAAEAINLIYVHDKQPGIRRLKEGKDFCYYQGKKKLNDKLTLERIKKLAIPPAWESVWICELENGHLQATGIDTRQRKQYRYHSSWSSFRNHTKFYRLYEFGKTVPAIRQQLKKDLAKPGLRLEKVLATVVYLMEQTSIRIGNAAYEKLYGSFGLTTLKDKHVKISGDHLRLAFIGKKGIAHSISLKSKKLARIVKQCRDIPGKELFQYYDEEGNHKAIDSGMVNDYLKSITGQDFTAKDFRTWIGTVQAIRAFRKLEACKQLEASKPSVSDKELEDCKKLENAITKAEIKRNVLQVLDEVAAHLGNTRAVCKKYYIHPVVIELYECNELENYIKEIESLKRELENELLNHEERLLLFILEQKRLI